MEFTTKDEFETYSNWYVNKVYLWNNDLIKVIKVIPKIKKNFEEVSTGFFSSKLIEKKDTYVLSSFEFIIIGDVNKSKTYITNYSNFSDFDKFYRNACQVLSQLVYLIEKNETLILNNIKIK